jgi:oligopeptide/dipeptide ABC transporter ATP-binding protein
LCNPGDKKRKSSIVAPSVKRRDFLTILVEMRGLTKYFAQRRGLFGLRAQPAVRAVNGVSRAVKRQGPLGVVAETCDRVAVLYVGHVVEKGRTRDIFKEMKHPYTQGLLAAIPRPGSHGQPLQAISGFVPSGLVVFPGCPFEPRCSFAMEVCRQAPPPLVRVGEEHYVACYQFVEGASE